MKRATVSLAIVLVVFILGVLAWQHREIENLRDDVAAAQRAAQVASKEATQALASQGTTASDSDKPVSQDGYTMSVREAARLVATLCALTAAEKEQLTAEAEDSGKDEVGYFLVAYLVREFTAQCGEPDG